MSNPEKTQLIATENAEVETMTVVLENGEAFRKYQRKYYQENLETIREYHRNRYAEKNAKKNGATK